MRKQKRSRMHAQKETSGSSQQGCPERRGRHEERCQGSGVVAQSSRAPLVAEPANLIGIRCGGGCSGQHPMASALRQMSSTAYSQGGPALSTAKAAKLVWNIGMAWRINKSLQLAIAIR